MYTVNLFDRNYQDVPPPQLQLSPVRYSSAAIGGYEYAEIALNGTSTELLEALRWLRYYVVIRNRNHTPVWAGMVTAVTINTGGIVREKTIDGMMNRIAVAYTYDDANGQAVRETTAWGDNLATQAKYGIIEHLESQGDMESGEALFLRDSALSTYSKPATRRTVGAKAPGGTLQCRGLWGSLDWLIYNQPGGVVRYEETGNYDHLLGWGFTGTTIAFNEWEDAIHDLDGHFKPLREDDYIVVSGAAEAGNNGTFKVVRRAAGNADETYPQAYTATSIYFDPTDDIHDDAGQGFGFIEPYELINVSGAGEASNNRYYITKDQVSADHITVNPATIVTDGPGPSVTIEQGHSVQLDATLTTEYPGASVTVKGLGLALFQSFTLPVDVPFLVSEIYIRVRKVGTPVDSLSVSFRADSGGGAGPTGGDMEAATIAGSALGDVTQWVKFTFSGVNINYGVYYWLDVERTGSVDPDNYYVVELNEEAGYTGGTLKLWDGTTLVDRAVPADMPFQIWSRQMTTKQIETMLAFGNQLFSDYQILNGSGIYKRQYRDQDQTVLAEIENLLRVGTFFSPRLLARVTHQRIVQIYEEPAANQNNDLMMLEDGSIVDVTGQPLEPGVLPVAKWIWDASRPANADPDEDPPMLFLERAEWDCQMEEFTALEFKGAENPWEALRLL